MPVYINIKAIRTEPFIGNTGGYHVIIELLRGKEYVYNPDTLGYDLIELRNKETLGSFAERSKNPIMDSDKHLSHSSTSQKNK